MTENEYLTKREASRYLKIASSTFDKIRRKEKIPYYRFGRKIIFKKSDLDQWLESRKSV